ncbi:MAG: hypothetical protein E6J34_20045 [Chloroflexi bacterium]|nr:MAG: hypothetical protein E6J34_20045 [Chloroflexota bacterium]
MRVDTRPTSREVFAGQGRFSTNQIDNHRWIDEPTLIGPSLVFAGTFRKGDTEFRERAESVLFGL